MTERTAGMALAAAGAAAVFAVVSIVAAARACRCRISGAESAPGAERRHRPGSGAAVTSPGPPTPNRCTPPNVC
ncbi:hypothetical protein ACWGKU_12445 [Kitasatospora sp. NPDC054768]